MAQMVKEDKLKALDGALAQIEKQFGKGSVMKLGDSTANMNVETVPTGALSLDIALGLGGIPKGRIVEVYGPESSGKTTVALHMVAEVQKRGGIAGFIDAEHALDPAYAKKYRSRYRQFIHFPAGQWRAGSGNYRNHGAFRRCGHYHCGLCSRTCAKGRD